jgi:hypothetical protein
MLIKNRFNGYSPDGRRIYRIFDGGGGGAPAQTIVSGSELPEWAKPYAQETLQKAQAVSAQPYSYYGGPRIAGFSPLQLAAQKTAGTMTTAPQIQQATNLANLAGAQAFRAGQYTPGQFGNAFQAPGAYTPGDFFAQQVQAPGLRSYQMGAPERVSAAQVGTPTMGAAQTGYDPNIQSYQIGAPSRFETPTMGAAQTGFDPRLTAFQMAAPERVSTGSFTEPGAAERYMSPYMEQAIAPQLREARRASDIQAAQIGAEAAKQGAFGGGRSAILEAERRRNLATQTGDIRARGLQQAYEQAQQLYGTEQQRAMQAALANQQAGLTAGGQNLAAQLGVQQLGTQTGLQTALANLSSQQQANVQNQAAALQTQGLNAQQALQTALANQQAALGAQQLGTQTGLQTSLANLSAQQQANVQNQAAALQAQGLNAQQAMQAALANQQAGLTVGQQNLAAQLGIQQLGAGQNLQAQLANQQAMQQAQQLREQSRQFGAGQGLQAAGLGAQYGLAGQQLGEQSRQFGAGLGMQGVNAALAAAGQLGQLGTQQFGQQQGIVGLQSQLGAQQQALRQQGLTQAYQDFLAEQNYPYRQLGFMSDVTRGLPLGQQSTRQIYEGTPGLVQSIGSLGLGAYGLSKLGQAFKEGGIVNLAEGGYAEISEKVRNDPTKYSPEQIKQAVKKGILDVKTAEIVLEQIAKAKKAAAGIDVLPSGLPTQGYAPGGIVAFDDGGDVKRYQTGGVMYQGKRWEELQPYRTPAAGGLSELVGNVFSRDDLRIDPVTNEPISFGEFLRRQEFDVQRARLEPSASQAAAIAPNTAQPPVADTNLAGAGEGYFGGIGGGRPPVAVPAAAPDMTMDRILERAQAAGERAVPAGLASLTMPTFTPAQIQEKYQEAMPKGIAALQNELTPEFERLETQRKSAAQEAFQESGKISDRMDKLREAQAARFQAKEKDIKADRDRSVGIAFLEAAQEMATPGRSLVRSLVTSGATGAKSFMASKERLDKRADELSDAVNRLDEARVGDERERAAAKANLNQAMINARTDMIRHNETALNMNREDARKAVDAALARDAASANFQLTRQKTMLEAQQGAEANAIRAAQVGVAARGVEADIMRTGRPGPQLELALALGNGDPVKGMQLIASAQQEKDPYKLQKIWADYTKDWDVFKQGRPAPTFFEFMSMLNMTQNISGKPGTAPIVPRKD